MTRAAVLADISKLCRRCRDALPAGTDVEFSVADGRQIHLDAASAPAEGTET